MRDRTGQKNGRGRGGRGVIKERKKTLPFLYRTDIGFGLLD